MRAEHYDSQRRDLERLGIDWDDELWQSHHLDRYADALRQLGEAGLTYPCYCSRREVREAASAPHANVPSGVYAGTCRDLSAQERARREADGRKPAIRLRAQVAELAFDDVLCGHTVAAVDDMVLARRDGVPAYNLVVVVDDAFQGVQQVVRADDLLSSTPRQMHLADLLGLDRPSHAHVPLVLGPDGARLAKRDGAVTLDDRLALGETSGQVRHRLAVSLGMASAGAESPAHELLSRFEPEAIPRAPWQLAPGDVATGTQSASSPPSEAGC